jgi:hypothetical protein
MKICKRLCYDGNSSEALASWHSKLNYNLQLLAHIGFKAAFDDNHWAEAVAHTFRAEAGLEVGGLTTSIRVSSDSHILSILRWTLV